MHKTLADFIADARPRINHISADDLAEQLADGNESLLLIDTREPYEFERSHIPGALLIPRGLIESAADSHNARRVDTLCQSREKRIVLYCDTGGRSTLAAETLQTMGFPHVYNLSGGIKMWEAEDYELESGAYTLPLP